MTTIRVRLYVVPTRDREEILVFIQHFVVLELELGWNWVGIGLELAPWKPSNILGLINKNAPQRLRSVSYKLYRQKSHPHEGGGFVAI